VAGSVGLNLLSGWKIGLVLAWGSSL
jgi:hypothetical protein